MTFVFYKYTGQQLLVNKRTALASAASKTLTSVKVSGNQDLMAPTLTVTFSGSADVSDYNYLYIQDWARYYFIRSKTWLADSVWEIALTEDTLNTWAVAMANSNYYGIARYSGLGNKNLPDPRVTFQSAPAITEYRIHYGNTNQVPLQKWYAVKFISSQPFSVAAVVNVYAYNVINVAIMNEAAYRKFIDNYNALAEASRVNVGASVISVNRVRYIAPDSAALSDYMATALRFVSPFSGTSTEVSVSVQDGACYIISDPAAVADLFLRPCWVVNSSDSTVYFNTAGEFHELRSQFILKLPELQPIPINPTDFGKDTNFSISFNIGYEPFSEQYVIMMFPDSEVTHGAMPPVVQKAVISVPFLSDNSLDMIDQKSLNNTLSMIGGIAGGLGAGIVGASTGNVVAMGQGFGETLNAFNNYDMQQKQLAVSEYLGKTVSGTLGGSPDWVKGVFPEDNDARLIKVTQQPVRTFWSLYGIPDGAVRSVLGLAGSGYAELEIHDMPMLTGQTLAERDDIIRLMASGVYF